MLWIAMATAIKGPTSVLAENATANPSGALCIVMVTAMRRPSRMSSLAGMLLRMAKAQGSVQLLGVRWCAEQEVNAAPPWAGTSQL